MTVSVTVSDLSRKVNHLSNVVQDGKITTEFARSTSSSRIGYSSLSWTLKSPKTNTIAHMFIETWVL